MIRPQRCRTARCRHQRGSICEGRSSTYCAIGEHTSGGCLVALTVLAKLAVLIVDTGNMATESSVFYVVFLPSSLADQPRSFSGVATPAEAPTHGRSVRHSIYIFKRRLTYSARHYFFC
ncbi:hypothetical protein CGCFRS4_v006222 [Colletotrichum fructicola]|nr:hypothetical protein CGCFRS4_v006222 [Colletotrichum fructicola]